MIRTINKLLILAAVAPEIHDSASKKISEQAGTPQETLPPETS